MLKILKLSACIALSASVAVLGASCKHVHKWGAWERTESGHSRACASCGEEQSGVHDDFVCGECAEFSVLSFGTLSTPGFDPAHSDFAAEANKWFAEQGKRLGFIYEATEDFGALGEDGLSEYDMVMFLNNKPYGEEQRAAFENYMDNGGAWIGFHACAFTMDVENDWTWYHNDFLGSGNFKTNTWNPTRETLRVEARDHFSALNLPETFLSAYNEWYGWENDLKANPDITVLLSLDESTFPVGDKLGEMWQGGYFPVAWTNNKYKMAYINMGHNLQSYNTYEKQSSSFESEQQNRFLLDLMFGLTK